MCVTKRYLDGVDYAICPFDRAQVTIAALVCHLNKVPFAQMHAGEVSSGTFDDSNRHAITLWADMCLCAHKKFAKRVIKMKSFLGLPVGRVHTVGITHLDHFVVDEKMVPPYPYNMVVYNPPTLLGNEVIIKELGEIINDAWNEHIIWIGPNGDPGSDVVTGFIEEMQRGIPKKITYYPNLPRASFLGLMKNAMCVYGNSSSLIYEIPAFKSPFKIPVVFIGERNRIREGMNFKTGASKRIADLIEERMK